MNILIYRENFRIDFLPESFSNFSIEGYNSEIVDIGSINESENIDLDLSNLVSKGIDKKPDIVFIPSIIGQPLLYYGVRLAMHWRLDLENKEYYNTPIVIMGFEDEAVFYKNCEYSEFFKTPFVYYIKYNEIAIKEFVEDFVFKSIDFEIKGFIDFYNVKPPESYKSHHSITNEWSILRWAEALDIDNHETAKIKVSFGSTLYYKYLKIKYPISEAERPKNRMLLKKGKVLFIDDEVNKGWSSIFSHIIKDKLISFGDSFKDKPKKMIIEDSIKKVKDINPDLVILDLRLHDDDFEDDIKPEEITGFKILQEIKNNINKGIQIIIFSATNKVWNLLELQEMGADGFIMKESPELSRDRSFTKRIINNIYSEIDKCIEKSFLKDINAKLNPIYECYSKKIRRIKSSDEQDFLIKTVSSLDIAFELLNKTTTGKKYFNLGYLTYFQIIEDFAARSDFFEDHSKEQCFVIKDNDKIKVVDNNSGDLIWKLKFIEDKPYNYFKIEDNIIEESVNLTALAKTSFILAFKFGKDNSCLNKWGKLNHIRNSKVGHGGKKQNEYVNKSEINELLDYIVIPFLKSLI